MKGLAIEGSWLKHITACIGLVENFQVSGPPVQRDQRAFGFPPESLIVVEPNVCTVKASVGKHDQIHIF